MPVYRRYKRRMKGLNLLEVVEIELLKTRRRASVAALHASLGMDLDIPSPASRRKGKKKGKKKKKKQGAGAGAEADQDGIDELAELASGLAVEPPPTEAHALAEKYRQIQQENRSAAAREHWVDSISAVTEDVRHSREMELTLVECIRALMDKKRENDYK